jgi:hypothetical protein
MKSQWQLEQKGLFGKNMSPYFEEKKSEIAKFRQEILACRKNMIQFLKFSTFLSALVRFG